MFLGVGLVVMFVISLVDYHRLLDIASWAYGVSLVSLVAVLVVGKKVLGARRWINLGGGVHFQPSEWVKLVLILCCARFFWGIVGSGRELSVADIGKAFAAGRRADGAGAEAAGPGDVADLFAGAGCRAVSGRHAVEAGGYHACWAMLVLGGAVVESGKRAEAVSAGADDGVYESG